jgi:hypothetical protein
LDRPASTAELKHNWCLLAIVPRPLTVRVSLAVHRCRMSIQRPNRFCRQAQLEDRTVSLHGSAIACKSPHLNCTESARLRRHACSVAICSPAPAMRTGIDAFQPVVSLRKEATSVPFSPGTAPRIAASTFTSTLPSGCCCCRALMPARTTDVSCSFCETHRRMYASRPAAGLAVTCYLLVARVAVRLRGQQSEYAIAAIAAAKLQTSHCCMQHGW